MFLQVSRRRFGGGRQLFICYKIYDIKRYISCLFFFVFCPSQPEKILWWQTKVNRQVCSFPNHLATIVSLVTIITIVTIIIISSSLSSSTLSTYISKITGPQLSASPHHHHHHGFCSLYHQLKSNKQCVFGHVILCRKNSILFASFLWFSLILVMCA